MVIDKYLTCRLKLNWVLEEKKIVSFIYLHYKNNCYCFQFKYFEKNLKGNEKLQKRIS